MRFDHTALSKGTSNSHLLGLLTRRQTNSLTKIKSDWPGKLTPGFVDIKEPAKKPGIQFSISKMEKNEGSKSYTGLPRERTSRSVLKTSSKSISLRPTPRTTISMNHTWRVSQKPQFGHFGTSREKSTKDEKSESEFKNNQIISIIRTPPCSAKREAVLEVLREHPQPSPRTIVSNYIVDYSSFNFIDKVIEDPEKWIKFVHKKTGLR